MPRVRAPSPISSTGRRETRFTGASPGSIDTVGATPPSADAPVTSAETFRCTGPFVAAANARPNTSATLPRSSRAVNLTIGANIALCDSA